MIYTHACDFVMGNRGAGVLLALAKELLCVGCPISVSIVPPTQKIYLALYTTDTPIVCSMVLADFTFAGAGLIAKNLNPDESAPDFCEGAIEGPSADMAGIWQLLIDQQVWDVPGTTETLYGAALVISPTGEALEAGELLAACRFSDGPVPITEDDIVKLTGTFKGCCTVPPAEEEVPEV